jgi:hypothetical protein
VVVYCKALLRFVSNFGVKILTGGPERDIFICSPEGETTITDFVPGVDIMRGPCILAADTTSATSAETSTLLLPIPLPS